MCTILYAIYIYVCILYIYVYIHIYIANNGSVCFILTLAQFTLCDGELSTLRSTKELQIPHRFRKRSVLNVFEAISKSQHNTYIIYI